MTETASASPPLEAAQVRTFLIADVRGYTHFTEEHGDEAAARLARRFGELASETAGKHEGQVIELRGDEALTVFSSARQALRAAIDLQEHFAAESRESSLPFKVGVGLDSGEAIAVSGGYRGAALNLAARLCSLAGPGEVLASDTVAKLARKMEGLAYLERGLVQLKGFADPVRVMEVRETAGTPGPSAKSSSEAEAAPAQPIPIGGFLGALPESALIGRQKEMERILAAVDLVAQGQGRLFLLAGEPGIGKTRLAQETTLLVRNRGFLIATGRCYEPRQAMPFYPFMHSLAGLWRLCPEEIRQQVSQRWPYLGRLLPDEGLPVPPSSTDGMEEQERLFRSVTHFIQALAERFPVAVLLDDLQWADTASLELLQSLARDTRANRVLLLGTYRDVEVNRRHPLGRVLRELNREHLTDEISVRRLDQASTAALTAITFETEEISSEFAELLQSHTEGNPFFLQEVLRALVERGDVYREADRWERREIGEIEVPKSLRDAIGERLSRLPEDAQELLHEASVLGQTFDFDDLETVTQRSEKEVEVSLDEALEAGLIRETGKDEYAFNHALTQQALYSELSGRRKRRLHLAFGEALESRSDKVRAQRAAELAWHFIEGDDPEKALRYATAAGDQATAVSAHRQAEQHYRTALDLARENGEKPRELIVLEKLGTTLMTLGNFDEALGLLEAAAKQYQKANDLSSEARIVSWIGFGHRSRGTPQEGIERIRPLLAPLEGAQELHALASLYGTLSRLYFATSDRKEELKAAELASNLARQVGDEWLLAQAEVSRGTALSLQGHTEQSLKLLEESIPLSRHSGNLDALARGLNNLGEGYRMNGQFERATERREQALEVYQQIGTPAMIAFGLATLGMDLYNTGNWKRAEKVLQESLDIVRSVPNSWYHSAPLTHMGTIRAGMGEWETARSYLEEGIAAADRGSNLEEMRWAQGVVAQLDVLEGHPERAIERLGPLLKTIDKSDYTVNYVLPWLAWAYLLAGEDESCRRLLDDAWTIGSQYPLFASEILRLKGMLETKQKRYEDAGVSFAESRQLTQDMPHPYFEGRVLYEWAEMCLAQNDTAGARQHLEEAVSIFQRLGAKKDLDRAQKALDQLGA